MAAGRAAPLHWPRCRRRQQPPRSRRISMKLQQTAAAAVASLLLACGIASAQQQAAPPPNPMDVVPEKMPFDVPYGTPISLERADAVLNAAVGEARRRDWKLVCAVFDSGAQLVALKRMDGAQIGSIDIA